MLYPQLLEEISEIKSVFTKVNKEQILEEIDNKTVNLSYKVQNQLYKKSQKKRSLINIIKYTSPVLGLLAIFFLARNIDFNGKEKNYNELQILNSNELSIFGEDDISNVINDDYYIQNFGMNTIINESDDEIIDGFIYNSSNIAVEEIIYGMSETDFYEFYEEIEDDEINI